LIELAAGAGYTIQRFTLTQDSAEFQKEAQVMAILENEQLEALPITVIGGEVVKKGAYPTFEEINGTAGWAT
jgi:hypothetical protein